MRRRKFIIVGFLVLWFPFLLTAGWAAITVKDVEGHIMCMCKDKCGKVLANCTCDTSQQYRMDISLKLKEGLTKEQVKLLIEQAETVRDKAIIALFTESGLRLSELVSISPEYIDWDLRIIRILGKGRKEAYAPYGMWF